jgi:hypothetical protein
MRARPRPHQAIGSLEQPSSRLLIEPRARGFEREEKLRYVAMQTVAKAWPDRTEGPMLAHRGGRRQRLGTTSGQRPLLSADDVRDRGRRASIAAGDAGEALALLAAFDDLRPFFDWDLALLALTQAKASSRAAPEVSDRPSPILDDDGTLLKVTHSTLPPNY